ncbi:CapA family protein [Longispora sp. NPDC051575]|uniref:CapA family protein n=1 Tax=Longispora sp. NPDC051575 TaxID=3154943 RepID=UPI00342A898B
MAAGGKKWLVTGLAIVMLIGVGVVVAGFAIDTDEPKKPVSAGVPSRESATVSVTPSAEPPTVTITGTGDVIMGAAPSLLPPNSGRDFFKRAPLTGDLIMGNLESPLTEDTGHKKCKVVDGKPEEGCFAFRLPPSYATHLKTAGFQVLNLANNHTLDMGPAGLANTRTTLTGQGLQPTGGPGEITLVEAKGLKIAVLGFSPYSWGASLLDVPKAAELVRKAATQADLVVVQMQIGAEGAAYAHVKPGTENFLGENRGDPITFARAMVDAGADLIIGHGPHVLRGMEFYKGRLIAYSLGNFSGYRVLSSAGPAGIGGVVSATLRADGTWVSGKVLPTVMVEGGYPSIDPKKQALTLIRDLSTADLRASAPTIGDDGALTPQ